MSIRYRKDQVPIMKYRGGTMGIQAVPGAGKTFIITNLVAELLVEMKNEKDDGKILVLTYMNSAANNFKSRIKTIVEDKKIPKSKFEVMTIHSLAMKIIRDFSHIAMVEDGFRVIDEYKKNMLLDDALLMYKDDEEFFSRVLKFLNSRDRNNERTVERWLDEFDLIVRRTIGLLKYSNISDTDLKNLVKGGYRGILEFVQPVYSQYQKSLNSLGVLDYDDILMKAYNILKNSEDARSYYKNRYRYIFEDECQDSNFIQEKIIDFICNGNLVRVGDINQSITGTFTGADPEKFNKFCEDADFSYEMYMAGRSSKDIIDLANFLVKKTNEERDDDYYGALKEIYIEEVEKNQGYNENPVTDRYYISSKTCSNSDNEKKVVANTIGHYRKNNPEYSIGVLGFSNNDVNEISEYLESMGIEHTRLGVDTKNRKRLIYDLKKIVDFLISPGNRGFANILVDCFYSREEDFELSDNEMKFIKESVGSIEMEDLFYKEGEILKAAEKISSIGFDRERKERLKSIFINSAESVGSILDYDFIDYTGLFNLIEKSMKLSENEKMLFEYIKFYIENLVVKEDADLNRISSLFGKENNSLFDMVITGIYEIGEQEVLPGSITVSTLHKAKGMEWDAVIITDINSNNFPSSFSDYFRIERKYLRSSFRYPEAFINRDINEISTGEKSDLKKYEDRLKRDIIFERIRLLYVGITRAKRSLLIMNARYKFNKYSEKYMPKNDSEFYRELVSFINERKGN